MRRRLELQKGRTDAEESFCDKRNCLLKCVCSLLDTCGFVKTNIKAKLPFAPLRLCLHVCMSFLLVGSRSSFSTDHGRTCTHYNSVFTTAVPRQSICLLNVKTVTMTFNPINFFTQPMFFSSLISVTSTRFL